VHTVGKASANYRAVPSLGADASWLDAAVPAGSEVGFLLGTSLGPEADRLITWQTGFFNQTPFSTATWGTDIVSDPLTGAVTAPGGTPTSLPDYVMTPSSFRLAGQDIADRGAFILTMPSLPYRLQLQSSGIYVDGWSAPAAAISYFAATTATSVRVHIDRANLPAGVPGTPVEISTGALTRAADGGAAIAVPTATVSRMVSPTQAIDVDLAIPPAPFQVRIAFATGFKRSDYGQEDPRDLGGNLKITLDGMVISR
jgi:hypothetical protein